MGELLQDEGFKFLVSKFLEEYDEEEGELRQV